MKRLKPLTTNDVVETYARKRTPPKLTLTRLDRTTVLLEGDATALEFLGQFILAHSRADPNDCHNGLHPRAAGSAWFTKQSLPNRKAGRNETQEEGEALYAAVTPPSTGSAAPVMNDASSESRKSAAFAISSGLPVRPSGTEPWERLRTSSSGSIPTVDF
jgi:hypothetical protein